MKSELHFSDKDLNRFFSYVEFTEGCWEWAASKSRKGYGRFSYKHKTLGAHRAAFFIFNGWINGNLLVCHTCDNPSCVNPDHLFIGTSSDNARDRDKKGRNAKLKNNRCPNGHLYSGDNLYASPSTGHRYCKMCRNTYEKKRLAKLLATKEGREEYNRKKREYYHRKKRGRHD